MLKQLTKKMKLYIQKKYIDDLSFIKMEVCRNKEEFDKFLNYYRMYSNYDVNLKLLNALTVIVELDDMAVRILDKINLPIPYDSNFKEEIIKKVKENV